MPAAPPPTALVTGASRRLGRHLARDLAAQGYHVLVNHRDSQDEAEATVAEIHASGGSARALRADLGLAAEVEAMLDDVAAREGRLDVVVHNVGVYEPGPVDALDPAGWDRQLRPNLDGAFYLAHFARPLLREGLFVAIGYAGLDALVGNPQAMAYQVSKTGLLVLVKSLAEAWAPALRVNMISPGQLENSIDLPEDLGTIPAGRAGTMDDVAGALRYLLGAPYVTGVNLDVAGGYRLSLR